MKKLKAPGLVTVAIFTTITIVFWVFYSLYTILISPSSQKVPPEILAPISPTLDVETLDKLQDRVFFKEGEAKVFIAPPEEVDLELAETQIPTPTATASSIITPTLTE